MPTQAAEGAASGVGASAALARLQAVLDTAVDAIITIDEHGSIDAVNASTSRMFGYDAAELLGRNVSMLMPDGHRHAHDDYMRRYISTGEKRIIGIGREVDCLRKDGSQFPADLAVSEFHIGERRMFTGILRDVSDRRQAQRAARDRLDELAHAGRLAELGMTTSTIAHEVNQPLTAILGFANAAQRLLGKGGISEPRLAEVLEQIGAQSSRASAIIARIRDLARKRESVNEDVDLNAAVRGVLELLRDELDQGATRVRLDLAPDVALVRGDRIHVEQIVMNLVRNAQEAMIDAAVAHPALTIRSRAAPDAVMLDVSDNGPGLGSGGEDRVFDSFYTTKTNGLGVGLSICRDLAEAHGGRLWAEPGGVEGACFHLRLPPVPTP